MVTTTFENGKVYHQFEDGQKLEATNPLNLTEVLKKSIEHEKETRAIGMEMPPEPDAVLIASSGKYSSYDLGKRKVNRTSWKPLYEDMHAKTMAYRVWAVCGWSLFILGVILEIVIRIFS